MLKGEETRFFLMSLMIVVTVKAAVITLSPVSVTTTLNTIVNFACEGSGEQLFWRVQAVILTDSIKIQRDITVTDFEVSGNLSSLLTITALPINNGINIACHIYSFEPSFQQDLSGGTLTIRGVSTVEDIQWSIALQTLSWLPPTFYSDDIPLGEKPIYNVLINGISVTNITDTSLWLNISSCTTEFNVSIVTSVNEYQSIAMEYSVDNNGVYNISIVNYTLIFNETSSKYFYVELLNFIQSNKRFCDIAIVGKIQSWEEDAEKYYSPENIATDMRETYVLYIMDGLEPCKTYTAVISVINTLKNIIENEDNVTITSSPNSIQDVVLSTEGNGSVSVRCVYEESSTVDGCYVIFTHTVSRKKASFYITFDNSTLISLPTNGVYTVTAYAITNMTIVPWSCVQPKEVALTITTKTALDLYSSSCTDGITSSIIDTTDAFYVSSTIAISMLPSVPSSQSTLSASIVLLSTFGGLLLVLMLLIIISVAWCLRIRNKKFKGPIMENPAYGQVVELQQQRPSRVRTEVNPAYETVLPHANNALYESVW
ncbi:PREDICTED: uncharacterized protein LOC109585381 [Amphimedon queenslandica]|uniref:Ig-like domain-containing protein n=3 Tax=Amphimedon queenslandica TaxID=400682 RepID=A0AAN0JJ04_AMPQE|nr:PREDICTED: uncharacterized protein LOC109585381 [Amphimedon queenslandica]|eukprot:XP_019857005.1 PREDICTED: uncharacterized protein LOC109585381 [Amphimedon queenslandica]